MHDLFSVINESCELPASAIQDLRDVGFVVIPGPVAPEGLVQLAAAYDSAVACACPDDVSVGRSTTRVNDFVNRGPEFDALYVYQPVLEACCHIINQPFKLSTLHARTVRPGTQAQPLHVDYRADADGWPMIGFIFMVDDFRTDNGATRFVPGSHRWATVPDDLLKEPRAEYEGQVATCGPASSIIIYNGSVWHGHAANSSGESRRSIQGAYIRREARSGGNLPARMRPETLDRIGRLARYLLAL